MNLRVVLFGLMCALIVGCGGGGSSSSTPTGPSTIVGRVLNVTTGSPVSPAASVQSSLTSVKTLDDGSFSVAASLNTTSLTIDTLSTSGVWSFAFGPSGTTTDAGDLWVGPERVVVKGRVVDSTNGLPVSSATVSFAGQSTSSNTDGTFTLSPVPYYSASQAAFWGIVGTITQTNYFLKNFSTSPNVSVNGTVSLGDLLITPSNDPNPPSQPYTITGRVLPLGTSAGTTVSLYKGATKLRAFNVGNDGTYSFWIGPGSYTVQYSKGTLSAPTQSVTLTSLGVTVTVPDVTLQ